MIETTCLVSRCLDAPIRHTIPIIFKVDFLEMEGDVDLIEVHGLELTGDGSLVVSEEVRVNFISCTDRRI